MFVFWEIIKIIVFIFIILFISLLWYLVGWNDEFEYYKRELNKKGEKEK